MYSTNATVGTNSGTNSDGDNYIMYAIQNIRGYQKVVRYEGQSQDNKSALFIVFRIYCLKYCIIINGESGSRDKTVWDSERHSINRKNIQLYIKITMHMIVLIFFKIRFCK